MVQEWIRHSIESKPRSGVAVLVDGENLSADLSGQIIDEARKRGPLVVKRVYGNATNMAKWAAAPGFKLVHTGTGKNATDLLLAVEAVSLFHEGGIDTVVIASSDGDFSHLAHHLRERQLNVVGMGETKAPGAFRDACSDFFELVAKPASAALPTPKPQPPSAVVPKVRAALKENPQTDGWCSLSRLGKSLRRLDPDFDVKHYGQRNLTDVLRKTGFFEIKEAPGEMTRVRYAPPNP